MFSVCIFNTVNLVLMFLFVKPTTKSTSRKFYDCDLFLKQWKLIYGIKEHMCCRNKDSRLAFTTSPHLWYQFEAEGWFSGSQGVIVNVCQCKQSPLQTRYVHSCFGYSKLFCTHAAWSLELPEWCYHLHVWKLLALKKSSLPMAPVLQHFLNVKNTWCTKILYSGRICSTPGSPYLCYSHME